MGRRLVELAIYVDDKDTSYCGRSCPYLAQLGLKGFSDGPACTLFSAVLTCEHIDRSGKAVRAATCVAASKEL